MGTDALKEFFLQVIHPVNSDAAGSWLLIPVFHFIVTAPHDLRVFASR
jgi:hypothetical protein